MKLNYLFEIIQAYRKDLKFCKDSKIKVFNFWRMPNPEGLWFHQFITTKSLLKPGKSVSVYSVFDDRFKMKLDLFRPKIFFTGENSLYRPNYVDHCLKDVDLSLGSEYITADNYFRFPLWYLYFIKPHFEFSHVADWIKGINDLNKSDGSGRQKFSCLVAGHDPLGYRKNIFDLLSTIGKVDSGGHLLRNTNDLDEIYSNNKLLFIQNYRFNICPENSNKNGYVTEKIFESIIAGCLPVYWGSDLNPEPDILNQSRILFYDPLNEAKLLNEIKSLEDNKRLFREFYLQDVFNQSASEIIYDRLIQLEKKIRAIL